jgi:hypothetical protein
MVSGRRPASHAERIGMRKTFDFGGVRRRHRASFVEPDVFVELLRQIGPGNKGSRTRFRIRSIKGLRSAPSIDGNDSATSARFPTSVSSSGEPAAAPSAHVARLTFLRGRPTLLPDQWNEADVSDILAAVLIY